MKQIAVSLVLLLSFATMAAESGIDAVAAKEIEQLIAHLASSGCEFNRNGSWYGASRAVSHLKRKYEYLRDRQLAPTAEAFIERAASASSTSGKPYLVRCPGQPGIQSGDWFRAKLAAIREESVAAAERHR